MIGFILGALVSVAMFFAPKRFSQNFIYWLIPINVIADSMIGFFGEGETHTGIIRAGLIYPFLILSLIKLKPHRDHLVLFGFLSYLLALVLVSSNVQYSFWQLIKTSTGLLMYPLAFIYMKSLEDVKKLNRSLLASGALILLNFLIAQVFKIGESPYFGGLIYIGAGLVQITYVLTYMVLWSPISLETVRKKSKKWVYAILGLGVLEMLLTFRRSSLLAGLMGGIVMATTTKYKKQVLRAAVAASLFLGIFYWQYTDFVDDLFATRFNLETELQSRGGRVYEFTQVAEPFRKGNIKRILIGEEMFNSINLREFVVSDGKGRPLHVDYNILLHGAGLIGLFWYLYFHFRILQFNNKLSQQLSSDPAFANFSGVFLGLMAGHLVISASNQLSIITSLSTIFLLFGGLNSIRYHHLKTLRDDSV